MVCCGFCHFGVDGSGSNLGCFLDLGVGTLIWMNCGGLVAFEAEFSPFNGVAIDIVGGAEKGTNGSGLTV